MQIRLNDAPLDAEVSLQQGEKGFSITIESRGPGRNTDYIPAFTLLIERLSSIAGVITDATLASGPAMSLDPEARRIQVSEFPFPIDTGNANPLDLSNAIRRSAATAGRTSYSDATGGNPTRRLELTVEFSATQAWTTASLTDFLILGHDHGAHLDKTAFEAAIHHAINADPQDGFKWKSLERLFAEAGFRGSGALSNSAAERPTRVRQLLTRRKHPTFTDSGYSRYTVFVINREQATKQRQEQNYLRDFVVRDIENERPALPPDEVMESVLVLRHDPNGTLVPLALLKWGNSAITSDYETWYPGIQLINKAVPPVAGPAVGGATETELEESEEGGASGPAKPAQNVIFFGPPGTGKSYAVAEETRDFALVIRTVFHPEYSYGDFVGMYKPVSGSESGVKIVAADGQTEIDRPVVYYAYEPGVLVRAIAAAKEYTGQSVALIIEEINRGDCAAIFGDFFQLLDRTDSGRSQFGIHPSAPLGRYLTDADVIESPEQELYLPENLWLFATMNTSDQALFPMDAAFKRRWRWKSVGTKDNTQGLENVAVGTGTTALKWLPFVEKLNERILEVTGNEDKRIGAWYIKAVGQEMRVDDVREKLLFYLWHDVFAGRIDQLFAAELTTFDSVQKKFDEVGLKGVCPSLFEPHAAPEFTYETPNAPEPTNPA